MDDRDEFDDAESLRGRYIPGKVTHVINPAKPYILRQQADAIDECLAQWRETEEGKTYFTMSPGFLRDFAERLRREADEAGGDL